jgi:hypothetical protein
MGAAQTDFDNEPAGRHRCDTAPSLLYRSNQDGTFSEISVKAGCAFDRQNRHVGLGGS